MSLTLRNILASHAIHGLQYCGSSQHTTTMWSNKSVQIYWPTMTTEKLRGKSARLMIKIQYEQANPLVIRTKLAYLKQHSRSSIKLWVFWPSFSFEVLLFRGLLFCSMLVIVYIQFKQELKWWRLLALILNSEAMVILVIVSRWRGVG